MLQGDAPGRNASIAVGIIGFGRLARLYYAPALREIGRRLRLSVADPCEGSRAAAAGAFPETRIHADYRELLEDEELDAVLVATPPSLHLEIWRAAAALQLPVFMEKPFLFPEDLAHVDPADPAWRRLMIDFNRRFWPPYRSLARLASDGRLGRPRRAEFRLNVDLARWSSVSPHRGDAREGGVLHDLGSQMLDLALVTFPRRPVEVAARRSGTRGGDERVDLTLFFDDGLRVDCDLAYARRTRESVTIRGERGVLELLDPNQRVWLRRDPTPLGRLASSCADFASLAYRGLFRSRSMLRFSVRASLGHFFDALRSGDRFVPGFEDALRVARCTAAAEQSIAQGKRVALDGTGAQSGAPSGSQS